MRVIRRAKSLEPVMQIDEETRDDLEKGVEILSGILDGEPIDPDLMHYLGMLCLTLSQEAREADDDEDIGPLIEPA